MDKKKIAKTAGIAIGASLVAGLAFAAPSMAAPHNSSVVTAETVGKGGKGKGHGVKTPKANEVHVTQDITVTVPDDGATYKLVVTQTAPAAAANSTTTNTQAKGLGNRTIVVAVTGTGSVTVSVPDLHPGTYTAELVKVDSSQSVTVTAPSTAGTSSN